MIRWTRTQSKKIVLQVNCYMKSKLHQIISELYHNVESVEEREIIKNELAKMAQIC